MKHLAELKALIEAKARDGFTGQIEVNFINGGISPTIFMSYRVNAAPPLTGNHSVTTRTVSGEVARMQVTEEVMI